MSDQCREFYNDADVSQRVSISDETVMFLYNNCTEAQGFTYAYQSSAKTATLR